MPRLQSLAILVTLVSLLPVRIVTAAAVEIMNLNADAGVINSSSVVASNGDGVRTWTDQTGNSNNAVQLAGTNQPTLVTNALNGHAVVQFTGTPSAGDYMNINNIGAVTPVTQSFTVFLVGNIQGNLPSGSPNGANDYFFDGNSGGNRVAMAINPTGSSENQFTMYAGGAGLNVTDTRAMWQADHIYEAVFNGTNSQLYIDGNLVGTAAVNGNPGPNAITGLTLGADFDHQNFFLNGAIAGVQVWQGTLTPDQENQIGYALQATYGLTGAYVPEPSSWLLMSLGAVGALCYSRSRRNRRRD